MATVIYNGYTLPFQQGKISFETDGNLSIRYSVNFSILASDLDTVLDTLELPDRTLDILGQTYAITGAATRIKTRVTKLALDATGTRQYLTLTIDIGLKDKKPGDAGLRDWTGDLTVDEQGMKTVTVSGRWTGTAGGSGAFANYNANISALEGTVRSFYGGGTFFPARREITEHDRFDNELQFQSIMVESLELANVYTGAAEAFDSGIMFSKWAHSGSRQLVRGHSDTMVEFVTISFECLFGRSFATSRADLETRIAGLVIKRLKEQFNCSGVVLEREDASFSSTNQSARATWTFRCDNGPQFTQYDETVSDITTFGGVEKVTDGKALTMVSFSPGAVMQLSQRVVAEVAQGQANDPVAPSVAGISRAVLIPARRQRDRGKTNFGTSNIGIGDQVGTQEQRATLNYVKDWWVVVPSPDDPDSSEVRPAQPRV